jgi:hypothetical protein
LKFSLSRRSSGCSADADAVDSGRRGVVGVSLVFGEEAAAPGDAKEPKELKEAPPSEGERKEEESLDLGWTKDRDSLGGDPSSRARDLTMALFALLIAVSTELTTTWGFGRAAPFSTGDDRAGSERAAWEEAADDVADVIPVVSVGDDDDEEEGEFFLEGT